MAKAQPTMTPEQVAEWERKARDGSLFPGASDLRRSIEAALLACAADGVVPYGTCMRMARERGASSAYIYEIAQEIGLTIDRPPRPAHGTVARYRGHGCRCDSCRAAGSAYDRERYQSRKQT